MVSQLTAAHLELVYEMRKRRELYPSVTRSKALEAIERRIAREMIHRSKPPKEYTKSRTRFIPSTPTSRNDHKDRTLESSDPLERRTHLAHDDTDISDITFLPSNTERPAQTRAKLFEYVEVPPYRELREERRIQGRIRKKPYDIWDLYEDDVSAEYDVSLVCSPPPPSAIHQGNIQGWRQQSEKTLVFSDFYEAKKSDSRRGDSKATATNDEEVRVKLRKEKWPRGHEQRRSWKKKIITKRKRDVPQSIAPNVAATFFEQSWEAMPQLINPGVATVEETLEAVPQLTVSNVAHGHSTLEAIPPQPTATTSVTTGEHTLAGMHAWSQQTFEKFAFSSLMATESLLDSLKPSYS